MSLSFWNVIVRGGLDLERERDLHWMRAAYGQKEGNNLLYNEQVKHPSSRLNPEYVLQRVWESLHISVVQSRPNEMWKFGKNVVNIVHMFIKIPK